MKKTGNKTKRNGSSDSEANGSSDSDLEVPQGNGGVHRVKCQCDTGVYI